MQIKGEYVIVWNKGKRKIYTLTKYRRLRAIRYVLYALAIIAAVLLLYGATCDLGQPRQTIAIIIMCGMAAGLITACVVAACRDNEEDKNDECKKQAREY